MSLPFFYLEKIDPSAEIIYLIEETSKHVVQVLRMSINEELRLTDGKGNVYVAVIVDNDRKKCGVKIISKIFTPRPSDMKVIAISLVKNNTRFEWFLEKAAEIGVSEIMPLLCTRTEKQHFRLDRMKGILISAMLQSQQSWLPEIKPPQKFGAYIAGCNATQKFIAHCEDGEEKLFLRDAIKAGDNTSVVLIGPEGDFSKEEIAAAVNSNFIPVSLGRTRLRTETAGIVAAVMLCSG